MKERPRFVINCDGVEGKPHKPTVVAVYARDDDGTWLPVHSGVRDGKWFVMPDSGYRPAAGQFDWPCRNRRCTYRFRADAARVSAVLDKFMGDGESNATLRRIDEELRHAD